ncbi:hypothetical protein H6A66_08225 [Bacteroides caecigallinarum]|uniref:hypothetical protein n=1 Tax=Bacteroides caecigallinarum TaxID=1411144 RepID=UPI00195A004A|nr:hypothetical protein [Bacteroides caecigallinarum]MBM6865151.1 hypothetical protein [Bacteroides caecigallinarum]
MWVVILIIILVIVIYKFGESSGKAIGSVQVERGMRLKYSQLINHILEGHKDCKIITETRTYIRVGVSNYGGDTIFHIQQCPNNIVMIDYDVSNNPIFGKFSLRFTFPDDMNQDDMMEKIGLGVQKKMIELQGLNK